ncbi:MAG: STAS domain-containing protein [Patescibacteria group bacterium]
MAQITFKNKKGIFILKIEGEFTDSTSTKEFSNQVEKYVEECKDKKITPKIIIDLEKVHFMNATGLGVLIWAFTKTKNLNGKTILVNPSEKVVSLLTITKLITVFTVTSMEGALKI